VAPSIDERTLAAWLSAPTEKRAETRRADGETPLIQRADVEEHVLDPATGRTKRCDVTLRNGLPLLSAEMKRPEVADVDDPALIEDAYKKAIDRGFDLYMTCNFVEVALWWVSDGPTPEKPLDRAVLASGLRDSSGARARRREIEAGWADFLNVVEARLRAEAQRHTRTRDALPPQVNDLRRAITTAAEEASLRLGDRVRADAAFRDQVIDAFADQFGVGLTLDPNGPADRFAREVGQVAMIACFVVATRLLLYQALATSLDPERKPRNLDPLSVTPSATDPLITRGELAARLRHAESRTGDYDVQLTPTFLDDVAFAEASASVPVGKVWSELIDVVTRSDWTGPAEYVPTLYESLLTDEHRHAMGVHYTPEDVAEMVVAYSIRSGGDRVMDPAGGAGTFGSLAYARKRALGASHEEALEETYVVEVADFAASLSALGLSLADSTAGSAYPRVIYEDFFDLLPGEPSGLVLPNPYGPVLAPEGLDALIGNPPYIRFESRTPADRAHVHAVLQRQYTGAGVRFPDFTGKADLWTFFIAHGHGFLAPGGRLALVLSAALLNTTYGDAVLAFLARYYDIDAIIDSRVERFFVAKQNTVILFARKAAPEEDTGGSLVRLVRLKRPLARLLHPSAPRGKRAEDLVDSILDVTGDVEDQRDWDVHVVVQRDLTVRYDGKALSIPPEGDAE
jgi:hypothetical protein